MVIIENNVHNSQVTWQDKSALVLNLDRPNCCCNCTFAYFWYFIRYQPCSLI